MKLIKIEKSNEVWYFTNIRKCAQFINSADSNIVKILNGIGKTAKGWKIEYCILEDDIFKKIDPTNNYDN